jgi:hypothetical protein
MEKFEIKRHQSFPGNWYIRLVDGNNVTFLWKDLQLHVGTGYTEYCHTGSVPGYYDSEEEAERYLRTYLAHLTNTVTYSAFDYALVEFGIFLHQVLEHYEPKPVELTVAEIEHRLDYKIKIVSGE